MAVTSCYIDKCLLYWRLIDSWPNRSKVISFYQGLTLSSYCGYLSHPLESSKILLMDCEARLKFSLR